MGVLMNRGFVKSIVAGGALAFGVSGAQAADLAAKAKAPPAKCKVEITNPGYGPSIKANPDPFCFDSPVGEIYVGGAISGYGFVGSNPGAYNSVVGGLDSKDRVDFSNAQAWIQKADGPFQFYVQAGLYAFPSLGLPIFSTLDQTQYLYGPLPVAYGKILLGDNWSIQGGRMTTLIGSELPFTFQNINIQRGLLFNQENVINHGVQVNYSNGPLSASVAVTDGFFSNELKWLTGAVTYKLDDANTIGINGGFNFGTSNVLNRSARYQFATPLFGQNSGIISVNYTYAAGPWTITPYLQFTTVERDLGIGITKSASTYGAAILANYAFSDFFSLGGRLEYIEQSGKKDSGTTSLLYGAGSSAFSFTITPTFTWGRYFLRGEYSLVQLSGVSKVYDGFGIPVAGTGFGRLGTKSEQQRFLIETGITF